MARIRTIKPSFWTHEEVGNLPSDGQLLFIGMWNFADDDGYIICKPNQLRAQIFPYKAYIDCAPLLVQLVQNGCLECFVDEQDETYLHITHWADHQVVNHKSQKTAATKKLTKLSRLPAILSSPLDDSGTSNAALPVFPVEQAATPKIDLDLSVQEKYTPGVVREAAGTLSPEGNRREIEGNGNRREGIGNVSISTDVEISPPKIDLPQDSVSEPAKKIDILEASPEEDGIDVTKIAAQGSGGEELDVAALYGQPEETLAALPPEPISADIEIPPGIDPNAFAIMQARAKWAAENTQKPIVHEHKRTPL